MRPDLFAGPVQGNDSFRILARLANGGSVPAPARRWGHDRMQKMRLMAVTTLLAVGTLAWLWLPDVREAQLPLAALDMAAAAATPSTQSTPSTPATARLAAAPQASARQISARLAAARRATARPAATRPAAEVLAAETSAPQAAQPQAATIVNQQEPPPLAAAHPPGAKDASPSLQAVPQAMATPPLTTPAATASAAPPLPAQAAPQANSAMQAAPLRSMPAQEPRSLRLRPARPGVAQAKNAPSARSQRPAAPVEGDEDVTLLAAVLKHTKPQKPSASPPAKER